MAGTAVIKLALRLSVEKDEQSEDCDFLAIKERADADLSWLQGGACRVSAWKSEPFLLPFSLLRHHRF